ncbi:amino acid ABC transporter [Desulfonema ishimotonii]|uniref:Amino acid ABC transporter n=1 Tax=Desulfonema ishimotonii TaxID=45657 RepID=A0A401FY06_9BACT|nr:amino acid ABC transporter [Desulfonema ishimotonii]
MAVGYKMLFPLLLLFFSAFLSVNADADQTIRVGVYDFPPFFELKDGKPGGIWLDLMKKVFEKAGIRYSIKEYPAKRVIKRIVEGQADVSMVAKGISLLENNTLYSSTAVVNVELSVYTRTDTAVPRNIEALKGKKLLVTRGYSYGGLIKYFKNPENHIVLDAADRHELVFRKLKIKRADYAIGYSATADEILKKIGVSEIQGHPISNFDIFFVISKKTPEYRKVMDNIEKAFTQLKADEK